jgi:CBS-domain-containing membrane protein
MHLPKRKNIADISSAYRSSPVYVVIASSLTMAVIGVLAVWGSEPFIFPPLGPTMFVLFAFPLAQEANPRNVVGAHLVGLLAGIAALLAFGLVDVPPDTTDLDWNRLGAILFALAVAIAVLMGLRILHIPGVATALVVAMGLLSQPEDWAFMLIGAVAVTVIAVTLNRVIGIPHPLWKSEPGAKRATGRD